MPVSIDCCSALPRRDTLLLPGSDALAFDSLLPASPSPLEAALMSYYPISPRDDITETPWLSMVSECLVSKDTFATLAMFTFT